MPAYRYEALESSGRIRKGLIEAENERAARSELRKQSLVPMSLTVVSENLAATSQIKRESSKKGWRRWAEIEIGPPKRALSVSALTVWTRQLAGLVASGLPLERALMALSEEGGDRRQRELVAHLRSEVNAGASFAKALGTMPHEFDEIYRGVVAAGEQTGALGQVLERLANDLEERQTLKAKIMGAALYPAIVSLIAVVIVIFLVTYVVPQVATVFTSSKRSLPGLTVAMLAISAFMREWWWLMLGIFTVVFVSFRLALRNQGFRQRFDAGWLTLPLVGRLSRGYNAARFAGTLAMLAGAGVPILKALQAAAETLSNRAMQADAMDALEQIREGASLASAMASKRRFPSLLAMFARLGEQTGTLPVMLQRAANQFSSEVQRRAMSLATILEPLLIVAMGGIVMLIVLAVLLPIIQMNTWAK